MNNEHATMLQEAGELEQNPIGLPQEAAEVIVDDLNRHVASLFVLFHQYQKHHWLVEGPLFRDLHLYLEEAYRQVHADLDEAAERITVLGGVPVGSPERQVALARVASEPEGVFPVRDMLLADLRAEQTIIGALRESIRHAREQGDYGTERLLKKLLYHAEERAHHLDHYLQRNTLTPESA